MNAADRRRSARGLGILALLLVGLLIALWVGVGRGVHWHDDAAPPKLPPLATATPPPAVPPLERYSDVWQHPLFSPTRTPEPAAGAESTATGDLQLTGVVMLPGLKMAILHDRSTGKDYRVVEGQPSPEGLVLVELHPRSAVVESSGARLQLKLAPGPSPAATGSPTPEGAPPSASQENPGSDGDARVGSGANSASAASAMVTRHAAGDSRAARAGDGSMSARARARELKARIERERRRRAQQGGGG